MLELLQVSKGYASPQGSIRVLEQVDLQLAAGSSLALTGESGCGKSTLLHLVAGLDLPDGGDIRLDGQSLTRLGEAGRAAWRRQRVTLVFQQFNLIPSLPVADNLAFQARLAGRLERPWLDYLTRQLGLESLLGRYPEQLSGGQQQRVAVGRALAVRPQLLLADEPTGNLDEQTAEEVMALLLKLVADSGCSLLMVTHSQHLAARLDRQVRLSAGQLH